MNSSSLYIHWPFCASKCPYCDFNSHVSQNIEEREWLAAYTSELKRYQSIFPESKIRSVYFGGGTPSLMSPSLVGSLLDTIANAWDISEIEITLESNPNSVEYQKFKDFSSCGVNRVSLGVQSLNDNDLKRLGRLHSAKEALIAMDIAKACFDAVSIDFIYARQDQTMANWERELDKILPIAPEHISLYQLTIEDGTRFGELAKRGKLSGLPDGALADEMYELTSKKLNENGYEHYEISNFARNGAYSEHNLGYWRYQDYIGIGPGAHGRITFDDKKWATETELSPNAWLSSVYERNTGEVNKTRLSLEDQFSEFLLFGMRLKEGIQRERFETFGFDATTWLVEVSQNIPSEFFWQSNAAIGITDKGRMVLNHILAELISKTKF